MGKPKIMINLIDALKLPHILTERRIKYWTSLFFQRANILKSINYILNICQDNADTAEHPDDKNSLSSYASIDAVNLEQTTLCNQDSRNIDFSELIRSSTNRTVISYSAHTHNLTIQKTNDESNSLELHIAAFQNDTTKMQRLLDKLKQSGFKHLTVLLDVKVTNEII